MRPTDSRGLSGNDEELFSGNDEELFCDSWQSRLALARAANFYLFPGGCGCGPALRQQ